MTTLFISDLHLSDHHPDTLAQFESFIAGQARQAHELYILGDLFEAWVGDDDTSDVAGRVARALSALTEAGTKIFYMHGNRDFLLGQAYADRCKMSLLNDPTEIDCEGRKILITHGDLLCLDDKSYQTMRKIFHRPLVQKIFLKLPRFAREKFANLMRKQSNQAQTTKSLASMDVNPEAVQTWFEQHQCELMIHGHTHKPFHHQVKKTHRYVLGAWDMDPKVLLIAGGQILLIAP